ncbi:hypothetical protein KEM54_005686, partial [Ascosphaera aggregata]
ERLERKNAELLRNLALAQSQERLFRATIKSAETTTKGLKEQLQRYKVSVLQVRNQCATDIRKKDVELSKLKSHLSERQRGKRDGPTVITIYGGTQSNQRLMKNDSEKSNNIRDPTNNLNQETNEFLSRLCQELSDDNDAMVKLVKNTIGTLESLQGIADDTFGNTENAQQAGSGKESEWWASQPAIPQHEQLAGEVASVLNRLKEVLTNPSHVPLEELEARDNEILRLREGWEKMESRWKEALRMMDNRMADVYGSAANGGVTHGTSRRAEDELVSITKLGGQQDRKMPPKNTVFSDEKEENVAPRLNSEGEGRRLRPRLSKPPSDDSKKLSESRALAQISMASQAPTKRARSSKSKLSIIEEEDRHNELPKEPATPGKSSAERLQSSKVMAQPLNLEMPRSKSTRQALASPLKPTKAPTTVTNEQRGDIFRNDSSVPTSDSRTSPAKPCKAVAVALAGVPSGPAAPAQTPGPGKSPAQEDSVKTNASREETIVLQRNAEHKNITKRRRESKAGKKSLTSRAARSTGVKSKATPAQRQAEKQTPDAKATPLLKKRMATSADIQSRVKRRRSARLADGALH